MYKFHRCFVKKSGDGIASIVTELADKLPRNGDWMPGMGSRSVSFRQQLDWLRAQITLKQRGALLLGIRRPGHDFDHSSHLVPNLYIKLLSYWAFNGAFTLAYFFTTFTRRIYLQLLPCFLDAPSKPATPHRASSPRLLLRQMEESPFKYKIARQVMRM